MKRILAILAAVSFALVAFSVGDMVIVEKGTFKMGALRGDGMNFESPIHEVTFTNNFLMGKYEVTFDEYDVFCKETGRSGPDDEGWGRDRRPVINVSWHDAIAYCNWLSRKENLPVAYDSNGNLLDRNGEITADTRNVSGYRLPTEAEWEFAARGGIKSSGFEYSGSDDLEEVAWFDSNSEGKTHEVGQKLPNELGLHDMSGNVWEWCSDIFDEYPGEAQINPYRTNGFGGPVMRGGSWEYGAVEARVAYRDCGSEFAISSGLGLRICRTVLDSEDAATLPDEGIVLLFPKDNEVLKGFPRLMELKWSPVNLPEGTVYHLEIQYCWKFSNDTQDPNFFGIWVEGNYAPWISLTGLTSTVLDNEFIGSQPGRWRVGYKDEAGTLIWTDWRYFRFY